MKLTITAPAIFKFTLFAIIIGSCIAACKKPDNDTSTKLTVNVVDPNDNAVDGAEVRVWIDTSLLSNKKKVPDGIPKIIKTGADGVAVFDFNFGLLVNIDAAVIIYNNGIPVDTPYFETNFALLNDGEEVSKRIKLRAH